MLLIGFGNKARNGKDTAAQAVKDYFEQCYYPGFAAPTPKVGIFKYATELYVETSKFLEAFNTDKPAANWQGVTITTPTGSIEIPEWVQPNPNAKPEPLAPHGKHPKLLQWWGTEYRRQHFGQDYWIKRLFASIPKNLDIALIADVRFVDEADAIKQRGGYTVNVQRLREDGTQYFSDDRPVDHPSETRLDGYNWDFYLKIPHGHTALLGEQAITLAVYLRGLQK